MRDSSSFIGRGTEKQVHVDPLHPDKVIKTHFERNLDLPKVKAYFYLGKILHGIFPKHFPTIHASSPDQMVMERKHLDEGHVATQNLLNGVNSDRSKFTEEEHHQYDDFIQNRGENQKVVTFIRQMDELGVNFDAAAINFVLDENGIPVYVDNIEPWRLSGNEGKELTLNFNLNKMKQVILLQRDDFIKYKLLSYLERMLALFEEEKASLASMAVDNKK